ncbi:cadherin domain-containing protein [Rhizobium herbae]|uniref:Ca2+-binding RTX toxin-like protein n=1 Tax=Rhizobium herbae TaxID=508661 RepID=A0ABS4ERB5_9HYPH|nr:cadherin domain-containing protein [Rhizobium herbae]MBP1860484.1 Ca2+-binding RTX toxin-like protein [Rhizobium herbae]
MSETTQLSFSIEDVPMWGPNSQSIDQTYNLVNLNFSDQQVFSLGGQVLGLDVGLDVGFSYAALFNLAAHLKWDFGSMEVGYAIDAAILDTPEFSLNDIVHFDTSGFTQVSGQLLTSGLDPANFHFDVTMTYGAFAQFDTTTGANIGAFGANLANPISVFNLPTVTNTLFEANLSDVVNGSIPFNFPGALISGLLQVPLDPLDTSDTSGTLQGALADLLSDGSTIDFLQASLDIDGLIAAFFGSPSPLGLSLPVFTDPGGGQLRFDFDLIDTTASLNFRVDQQFEFTPDPIAVTMSVAETGQVLTGVLGDDFVFQTPDAGYGEHNVHASFNLTGELRNLTSLVINGELTLDIFKAYISNTILAPGLGFEFGWGPLISISKDWDLAKIALFDETFDVDLGTVEIDYVIPWERFYVGTTGNDYLTLTPHQVTYDGLAGNDTITGNALANTINGGADNDLIVGGDGADILDGGDGVDSLSLAFDPQRSIVNLSSTQRTIDGFTVDAGTVLDAYGFIDQVSNFEEVYGSGFDDIIIAGDGGSALSGGDGDDQLFGSDAVDTLLGGKGIDTLHGGAGNDIVQGGEGDDFLYGDAANDILMGQWEDDHIDGGAGFDLADYQIDYANVVVNLSDSDKTADGVTVASMHANHGDNDTDTFVDIEGAIGSDHDDHFFGGDGENAFYGRDGEDTFFASGGADTLVGEGGDDTYYIDSLQTIVFENLRATGGGYDTIYASIDYSLDDAAGKRADIEELRLTGSARGATGNALGNAIYGTVGDDYIDGRGGSDTLYGAGGNDTYVFDTGNDRVVEDLDGGHDTILLATGEFSNINTIPTFSLNDSWAVNVEDLFLTDNLKNVHLVGNALGNVISGNQNAQTIDGLGGNDTLIAIGGGDTLRGGDGDDTGVFDLSGQNAYNSVFEGGGDVDTLVMDWSLATVDIVYGGTNYRTTVNAVNSGDYSGYAYMSFSDVERFRLSGGSGNDNLVGDILEDVLIGGAGIDRLEGKSGKGTYHGDSGTDIVIASVASVSGKNFTLALQDTLAAEIAVNSTTDIETKWQGVEVVQLATGSGDDMLDTRLFTKTAVNIHGYTGNRFDAGAGNDIFKINYNAQGYDHVFAAGDGIDTLLMDWSDATISIVYGGTNYRTTVNAVVSGDYGGYMYVSFSDVERFQLTGGSGDDNLVGGAIDDILVGGAGIDRLEGKTGKGAYDGGLGTDVVIATVASDAGKNFTLALQTTQSAEVTVNAGTDVETKWHGVEVVQLATAGGDDLLDARLTDKTAVNIHSYAGNRFESGAGDDTFKINYNSQGYEHTFIAGDGTDTLVMDWSDASVDIVYGQTNYRTTVNAAISGDYSGYMYVAFSGVERFQLTGGIGNDNLVGGALDDVLIGGNGIDRLEGKAGKGTYNGGTGTDIVIASGLSEAGKNFVLALQATQGGPVVANGGTAIETTWQGIEVVQLATGGGGDTLDARLTIKTAVNIHGYTGNRFDSGSGNDTFKINFNAQGYDHVFAAGDGTDTMVMDWSGATNGIVYGETNYRTTVDAVTSGDYSGYMYVSFTSVERFQLTGGAGGDNLVGGLLDDILIGNGGSDRLEGKAGKGTYDGGTGIDIAIATVASTADTGFSLALQAALATTVTVNGGTGIETKWRGIEVVQLGTGAGGDILDAQLTAKTRVDIHGTGNRFDAGAGNDTFKINFNAQGYSHVFTAGDGIDTLVMDWAGANNDIVFGDGSYRTTVNAAVSGDYDGYMYVNFSDVERFQLTGGAGNDNLVGGALDDILVGGGGYDRLDGKAGKGTYNGGSGTDVAIATIASDIGKNVSLSLQNTQSAAVTLNSGTDIQTIWQGLENVQLGTGAGDDTLDATLNVKTAVNIWGYTGNSFDGGAGNDTFKINFNAQGYSHSFAGGDGIDTIVLDWSGANNAIVFGDGNYRTTVNAAVSGDYDGYMYVYYSNVERFQLMGGAGDDNLVAGALDDILSGGAGVDRLEGGAGKGSYNGGNGTDVVIASIASTAVADFALALQATQPATIVVNSGTTVETSWRGVETVQLTTAGGDDVLDARLTVKTAVGIWGYYGNTFDAGAGNDTFKINFNSQGYSHAFAAGDGVDTLVMDWSGANNSIVYGGNHYRTTVNATASGDYDGYMYMYYSGVERFELTGGSGNDDLRGGDQADTLSGGAGDDGLTGGQGADLFVYSGGNDTIADFDITQDKVKSALFSTITSFTQLLSKIDQTNHVNTVINFAAGTSLTLMNLDWENLKASVIAHSAPTITSNGGAALSRSVAENTTAVSTIAAVDPDGGAIAFSLTGTDASKFQISATGVLSFKTAPNFEVKADSGANNVYDVIVKVTDNFGLTDTQALAVTVTNVEEGPAITSNGGGSAAVVSVAENTTAITTVVASDPEGDTRTYSISGGADAARFTINATTGALVFKAAADFETKADVGANNVYDVIVKAASTGGTDTQALAVTVTNVNEAPRITSNGGGSAAAISIAENKTAVTTVTATDPDTGATRSYSISGGVDAARFTINAATGALAFKAAADFETKLDSGGNNIYDLVVKVTDNFGLTDTQALAVTMTDVNEAPRITSNGGGSTAAISIKENTTAVTTVVSADPDTGASRTYALSGGADAARFTINATTGALVFKVAPDFEAKADAGGNNVYDVIVRVTDNGGLTDTQSLAIGVGDVNEAPNTIALSKASVAENSAVGTKIGTVSAVDPEGKALTFTLTDNAGGLFKLTGSTLQVAKAIDYEKVKSDTITVEVKDADGLAATKTFTITVTNVAESAKAAVSPHDGTGTDIFLFHDTAETTRSLDIHDKMFNFSTVESGRIDLSGLAGNAAVPSGPEPDDLGTVAFKHGEAAALLTDYFLL